MNWSKIEKELIYLGEESPVGNAWVQNEFFYLPAAWQIGREMFLRKQLLKLS